MPISLKPHNLETYNKIKDMYRESVRIAIVQPTGTGKMYIALKFLEENQGKRAVYVAPSNAILHDVQKNIYAEGMTMKEFPKIKRITYQKLKNLTDEEIEKLGADIIILDEFHHCGAPEWGNGVERLIQQNKGAKILGLSATPIRYFDGLRDMSDELFANNIAIEMTLEEAVAMEILPESTYISSLYGYNKDIEVMQEKNDKMRDSDRRNQVQNLINDLRKKVDENTENLPDLFSKYMKKDGKYIVFCKNIEDMNEKMEQAQKMFGKVNPNITVRGVSSKIRETDKILKAFESDNEEGTLKLLYAVDMLNEGYHDKNLDGVIMMRPTFSPTIFTQQLGRALSVSGSKKPIIFDLVNNFDSCKIIEDFAERMKQYKGKEGNRKSDKDDKIRISIFDKTKEFREIAEKITNLLNTKVTLEEKIELFEEFAKIGEKLDVNTVFKGYPIGQWATQIRSAIKIKNTGKEVKKINPTEEQLERLENLGVLEKRFDATIDEKIDAIIEFRKKYPQITIVPSETKEDLKTYCENEDEYKQLQEEYDRLQNYYAYIRARKSKGKLNEDQVLKCKEGGVGGVFGYPTIIIELAKKYNVEESDIDQIFSMYGTLDKFYEMYKTGKIKNSIEVEHIIKDVVDVDGSDIYDKLWKDINGGIEYDEIGYYSSNELMKAIEKLTDREKQVIVKRYGLIEGTEPEDLKKVGEYFGVGRNWISQIENRALRRLKKLIKNNHTFDYFDDEILTDEEREKIKEIEKDIQLQNGNLSENIEKLKSLNEKKRKRYEKDKINKLIQRILEGQASIDDFESISSDTLIGIDQDTANKIILEKEKFTKSEEYLKSVAIRELKLSTRAYNALWRAGINTLKDLSNRKYEDLLILRNLGNKGLEEIVFKLKEMGIELKKEDKENDNNDKKEIADESNNQHEELVQRILEKQGIIEEQQDEINRLRKRLEIHKQ